MVSTGESHPLPVGSIVGGPFRGGPPATPLARKTPSGADSGASSYMEPPERMESGGPRREGFRYMLPVPAPAATGQMNGELGFYSGEGA